MDFAFNDYNALLTINQDFLNYNATFGDVFEISDFFFKSHLALRLLLIYDILQSHSIPLDMVVILCLSCHIYSLHVCYSAK